jgi:hypothetical protein
VSTSGARQSDVRRVDAQRFHQVEQFDLLFDRRLGDGGRLQPIAQRFIVDADVPLRRFQRRFNRIPIVN